MNGAIRRARLTATVIGSIYQNMSAKVQIGCRNLAAASAALHHGGNPRGGISLLIGRGSRMSLLGLGGMQQPLAKTRLDEDWVPSTRRLARKCAGYVAENQRCIVPPRVPT